MKPFFAIDLTSNKKNTKLNGGELIAKTSTLRSDLKWKERAFIDLLKKAKLPLFLRIIRWVCGGVAFFLGVLLLELFTDADKQITFGETYARVPWMFWLIGLLAVAWLVISCFESIKNKNTLNSEEAKRIMSELSRAVEENFSDLGVPDDYIETEIFSFLYVEKNGEIKIREKASHRAPFTNCVFLAFADVDNLYLANVDGLYAIEKASITAISRVNKTAKMPEWHKDEAYNSAEFKKYKIYTDKYNCYYAKPYYVLKFSYLGTEWGIYFPSYELETFEKLTGVRAEEF